MSKATRMLPAGALPTMTVELAGKVRAVPATIGEQLWGFVERPPAASPGVRGLGRSGIAGRRSSHTEGPTRDFRLNRTAGLASDPVALGAMLSGLTEYGGFGPTDRLHDGAPVFQNSDGRQVTLAVSVGPGAALNIQMVPVNLPTAGDVADKLGWEPYTGPIDHLYPSNTPPSGQHFSDNKGNIFVVSDPDFSSGINSILVINQLLEEGLLSREQRGITREEALALLGPVAEEIGVASVRFGWQGPERMSGLVRDYFSFGIAEGVTEINTAASQALVAANWAHQVLADIGLGPLDGQYKIDSTERAATFKVSVRAAFVVEGTAPFSDEMIIHVEARKSALNPDVTELVFTQHRGDAATYVLLARELFYRLQSGTQLPENTVLVFPKQGCFFVEVYPDIRCEIRFGDGVLTILQVVKHIGKDGTEYDGSVDIEDRMDAEHHLTLAWVLGLEGYENDLRFFRGEEHQNR